LVDEKWIPAFAGMTCFEIGMDVILKHQSAPQAKNASNAAPVLVFSEWTSRTGHLRM
jgi:hypothetical protein